MRRALAISLAVLATLISGAIPAWAQRPAGRPNVILVLTDDLSWNLVRFMPQVKKMQREGMTFTNYFVSNSLCCPSRASIFTGRYPHNHGVLTNTPPTGGFWAFRRGAESETFATALRDAGYRTAMMGKYLNGYQAGSGYVPPGWSNWQVPGSAYDGFGYLLNANGRTAHYGKRRRAYVTDVLRRRGKEFVSRVARHRDPFFLEIATFAPHHPYTPAPRHRFDFPYVFAPRNALFNVQNVNAPQWLAERPRLTIDQVAVLDEEYRRRAQSVEAVDEMVGQLRAELQRKGEDDNTYLVFSSDNGFHMGEHGLTAGKTTAFDHDVRVPLIIVGPGVPRGASTDELIQNVDLAPTFMRLGGVEPPPGLDGRGFVGLLHGRVPEVSREAALIEHHRPEVLTGDPDRQSAPSGVPPSYAAMRTHTDLYVEYLTGEREWYDLVSDPDEIVNRYDELDPSYQAELHERLAALSQCSGSGCRYASTGP